MVPTEAETARLPLNSTFARTMNNERCSKIIFRTALFIYSISLAFPVYYTKYNTGIDIESAPTIYGIEAFLLGWTTIFSRPDYQSYAWLANIMFCVALAVFKNSKASILFSTASIILGLTAFSLKKIWNDKEPPMRFVESLGPGFYVWEMAFVILLAGSLILMVLQYLNKNR